MAQGHHRLTATAVRVIVEIGSLGPHFLADAVSCIPNNFELTKPESKQILLKLSKVAITYSFHILNLRNSASWDLFLIAVLFLLVPCQVPH